MREPLLRGSSNRLRIRRGFATSATQGVRASESSAPQFVRREVSSPQFAQAPVKLVVSRTSLPSNIRQESQGSSELRHAHYVSVRQQQQSVVGASRRRAAPGSQSLDPGALVRSGTIVSSRKKTLVAWRRCQIPGNSPVPPKELVAYAGNRVPHRASP